jgi:hypothetical protein
MSLNRGYLAGVVTSVVFILILLASIIPESCMLLQNLLNN